MNDIKTEFMNRFDLRTIDAVDCTHVPILKATGEEHNLIKYKGYHSQMFK